MSSPVIFVSYSRDDKRMLRALRPYFQSLQRAGLAQTWTDLAIEGGAQWRDEIERALASAKVAVLLISQAFLASSFIQEQELPRILQRQSAGALTILPVFLSPSTVDSTEIGFVDLSGRERTAKLSMFQGFGTPDRTLSELEPRERKRLFLELYERIRQLAGTTTTNQTGGGSTAAHRNGGEAGRATDEQHIVLQNEGGLSSVSSHWNANAASSFPSGVILDRHYAYTLTEYTHDHVQRGSAQLQAKYYELFDVLTCAILLFDEIYLEQHHVSSLDWLLDQKETDAFGKIFTPFSVLEDVGSSQDQINLQGQIQKDLNDPALKPVLSSFYGRKPVRAENTRELIIYLNRILARARITGTALFARPIRVPLINYRLLGGPKPDDHTASGDPAITIEVPARKCRSLDELANLRADPEHDALRRGVSDAIQASREATKPQHRASTMQNGTSHDYVIRFGVQTAPFPSSNDADTCYLLFPRSQ